MFFFDETNKNFYKSIILYIYVVYLYNETTARDEGVTEGEKEEGGGEGVRSDWAV